MTLKNIIHWLRAHEIPLNTCKTEVIILWSKNKVFTKHLNFCISGQKILSLTQTKYQQISVDENLKFKRHTNNKYWDKHIYIYFFLYVKIKILFNAFCFLFVKSCVAFLRYPCHHRFFNCFSKISNNLVNIFFIIVWQWNKPT